MLRRWLNGHEVSRWWGDPVRRESLFREDLGGGAMTMLIVCHGGVPFAYVQHCDVHDWARPIYPDEPAGTHAIDLLIGDPAMAGQGHGPLFLRIVAQALLIAGAARVIVDPDPANARACRAYARAGFVAGPVVSTVMGTAMLMHFAE
jgi:aminoglycoside 6'-N-acetyltransferase